MSQEFLLDAPLPGTTGELTAVPDGAFADEMLGPGIAISPSEGGTLTVHSPASGLIRTIHPHAFVLQVSPKIAALVHLGIDTYRAETGLFKPLVEQGRYVTHLQPVIEWNVAATMEAGFSPIVPITILGFKKEEMQLENLASAGSPVAVGQELLRLVTHESPRS